MKIKKSLVVFGTIALLCLTINAGRSKADGGIFIPDRFSGYETGQKAFVYFTGQSETLVVSANFRANAKDFSWVIPTPAKPEIDKANSNLFKDLEQMTNTGERPVELGYGLSGTGAPKSSSVQIIEQKKVGIYDTAILKATDEKALGSWLVANGYTFPADKNSELKSYVDNGWYFAIAKIQNDSSSQAQANTSLENGTLTPLKLTFQSDKIIYPMKLTGIALRSTLPEVAVATTATATVTTTSSPSGVSLDKLRSAILETSETVSLDMPIKLYVLADHKVQNDSLQTDWANWASTSNIANINTGLGADDIPGTGKYYLTAMSATIPATKMSEDLIITNTDNDQVYPTPANKTGFFWIFNIVALILTPIGFALFPPGLIFILFTILQRYAIKRKWAYIFGLIYESFVCLLSCTICVGIFSLASAGILKETGILGFAIGALITLFVAVFFTIKMFKRYAKTKRNLL